MRATLAIALFAFSLAWNPLALAQESPGYRMERHDLNAGGCPQEGLSLGSQHYEIKVGSLGEGFAVTAAASTAHRLTVGFPSTTATPAPSCILDCSAKAPSHGAVAESLLFQATADPVDCAGTPTFAWTFGDGGTSTLQDAPHAYATAGTFSWTLTVSADDQTCARAGTVEITAAPTCSLTCDASAPATAKVGAPVAFQATATATHCTGTPAFSWAFGDGGTSAEQNPSHTYSAPGPAAWVLTVTVDDQTCTKGGTVDVAASGVPGDCDGAGVVTIGEVQKAINMFLGTLAPDCGVDCSGDGTVSIGEVQKVINAFLGLASSC